MNVKCKKDGCKYVQEFHEYTFEGVEKWMRDWIKENWGDMKCIHKLEEVK